MSDDLSYLPTTIVYALFGIFGIVGNGLVLLVIALIDDLHGVTNLFIANQSLIDLCTSVILIANYVIPLPPLPIDRPALASFLCKYWYTRYPFWALITASSLNLVLMTLERFCAVFYPIRFRRQTNSKLLKFIAFLPWAIGFLFQLSSGKV
ncbi:neuromedin-U receptor 2-like [Strongylocentrotus purpuratus]|uniref:G-protein coupled receptors family 1 profile domain-containing protein n=1 Tax=Strongylocentrotus purpuratus TaxID=7668 RepID=A0A7M7REH7_STRPU|nr:neuromedin-U receptor 2-like [Strongylocentrotus purpuratus]|eukprot:XP_785059.1 PREDICTED: neuromedin-U receptor 2-like [Strongylocentrotus purpuratus]